MCFEFIDEGYPESEKKKKKKKCILPNILIQLFLPSATNVFTFSVKKNFFLDCLILLLEDGISAESAA